jgi:hypothetical protein
MSKHYRVTFETSSPQSAIFAAMDLLEITGNFTFDLIPSAAPATKAKTTRTRRVKGEVFFHARPAHHKDPRIVWDGSRNRIDVSKSLHNIGMTRENLTAMQCKQGSIEHTLKRAMHGRGY